MSFRKDEGLGLVEMLVAMMLLTIGLFALLGAFTSGIVAVRRADRVTTATTLANTQLELYRGLTYTAIALDPSALGSTDAVYRSDTALPGGNTGNEITTTAGCSGLPSQCNPSRTLTGPDGSSYRVDTYVVAQTPAGGRPLKLVTVVVRDGGSPATQTWVRDSSSFDQTTG